MSGKESGSESDYSSSSDSESEVNFKKNKSSEIPNDNIRQLETVSSTAEKKDRAWKWTQEIMKLYNIGSENRSNLGLILSSIFFHFEPSSIPDYDDLDKDDEEEMLERAYRAGKSFDITPVSFLDQDEEEVDQEKWLNYLSKVYDLFGDREIKPRSMSASASASSSGGMKRDKSMYSSASSKRVTVHFGTRESSEDVGKRLSMMQPTQPRLVSVTQKRARRQSRLPTKGVPLGSKLQTKTTTDDLSSSPNLVRNASKLNIKATNLAVAVTAAPQEGESGEKTGVRNFSNMRPGMPGANIALEAMNARSALKKVGEGNSQNSATKSSGSPTIPKKVSVSSPKGDNTSQNKENSTTGPPTSHNDNNEPEWKARLRERRQRTLTKEEKTKALKAIEKAKDEEKDEEYSKQSSAEYSKTNSSKSPTSKSDLTRSPLSPRTKITRTEISRENSSVNNGEDSLLGYFVDSSGRLVHMDGFLLKRSEHGRVKKYRKRWFKLSGEQLIYYKRQQPKEKSAKGHPPVGIIHLRKVTSIERTKGKKNQFDIITPDRVYNLEGESDEDIMDWIVALDQAKSQINDRIRKISNAELDGTWFEKEGIDYMDRKEGNVEMKGKFGWNRRFIVLQGGIMLIKKSQKDTKIMNKFSLYNTFLEEYKPDKVPFSFQISSPENSANHPKSLILRTDGEIVFHEWLNAIQMQKVILEETVDAITL